MKKYKTPKRFTPFFLEHSKREGSLCVCPGKVMSLSDDDIAKMRQVKPKVAMQLKELPAPKRPAWADEISEPEGFIGIDFELKAPCEGCDELCADCEPSDDR